MKDVNLIISINGIREAAIRTKDFRMGALPVTDEDNRAGTIIDRGIVNRAVAVSIAGNEEDELTGRILREISQPG